MAGMKAKVVSQAKNPAVDGRTERWREHRIERRREFVDAALSAMQKHGPDVSMADIAAAAGAAKPKLYRHFEDKADLFHAVSERISQIIAERLAKALKPSDPPLRIVRQGLNAWLSVVEDYPEVFRFLLTSSFVDRREDPLLEDSRKMADALAALLAVQLGALGVSGDRARVWGHAIIGAVGGATLWWSEQQTISKKQLVDYLTPVVWGSIDGMIRETGVVIENPDEPVDPTLLLRAVRPTS